jgi:ubiquinone/menaquinone biosynthesis C-methylase UbiE
MTERTNFYPHRFKDASRYYTTGRPWYPKRLAERVANLVGLTAGQDVLDLGTGPGFLAIDFASLANAVVAVDPSPEMLAEARQNARRASVDVRFVQASSYELGAHLGRFKLVTIGRAFHWMNREETLKALDPLIEPGGAIAIFGTSYPDVPTNVWQKSFQNILDGYSTEDPARPQIRAATAHEAVLLSSAFDHLERVAVLESRRTPVERLVDRALSFASTWHGRPGSREEDLAVDVRKAFAPYADSDGNVLEVLEGEALVAFRSRDLSSDVRIEQDTAPS